MPQSDTMEMAAEVVATFVSNNPLPRGELPALIQTIHDTFARLSSGTENFAPHESPKEAAVLIRKSITPEYLICLAALQSLILPKSSSRAGPVSIASSEPPSTSDISLRCAPMIALCGLPCVACRVGVQTRTGSDRDPSGAGRWTWLWWSHAMYDFEGANWQPRSVKCEKCKRIFIKNERSARFCSGCVISKRAERLAWAFAEDVGPNLIGTFQSALLFRWLPGNLVKVKRG
jgi:ROS/MUCR transcriptional regulator protein